jgi:hypothetical protein
VTRHAFVSVVAQHENLGDAVIRREMVRWLALPDVHLHVLVGDMPDGYLDVVDLPGDATRYRSNGAWLRAMARHALRGDAGLALAPGPQFMHRTPHFVAHQLGDTAALALLRIRRCPTAKLGRSLRPGFAPLTWLERLQWRWLLTTGWVRDEPSVAVTGGRAPVGPDIAFALAGEPGDDIGRTTLVLSPRRPDTWRPDVIARWIERAEADHLEPVLLTQVQLDEPFHRELAERHGIRHVAWGTRTHAEQLQHVLATYDTAERVVSDRLHALVLGITRGATAELPDGHDDKITPALAAAGTDPYERLAALRRQVTTAFEVPR